MRAVLYSRVSTAEQNPEVQLEPLRSYAQARGLTIVNEFVDHGVSGSKTKRPALDAMLKDAKRRAFDMVLIVKLDRLARSVRHLTTLGAEFEALGIDLCVLDQAIDTSTPAGRLLFHVLASIGEFERDLIRERTKAGMAAAKRRGSKIGRPRALRGSDTYRLEQLVREGKSKRAIARELGVSPSTVSMTLERLTS